MEQLSHFRVYPCFPWLREILSIRSLQSRLPRIYIFRFAEDYAETLVFRRKGMLEATEPLMSENGIPRRGSDDVLAVWNGKIAKN